MEGIRCYLRALLRGLAHVHSKKIIHRDVKPSNFLYDPVRKTGILVDFGLAERQEDHSEPATQRTGSIRNSENPKSHLKRSTTASLKHGPIDLAHQTLKGSTGGTLGAAQKSAQPSGSSTTIRPNSSIQASGIKDAGIRASQGSSQQANAPSAATPSQPALPPPQLPNLIKHDKSKATNNPISVMTNREPGYLRRDPR